MPELSLFNFQTLVKIGPVNLSKIVDTVSLLYAFQTVSQVLSDLVHSSGTQRFFCSRTFSELSKEPNRAA